MKRFKYLILLSIILCSCSCVKYETNVTIDSDKSVNFEINLGYAINSNNRLDINELKDTVSPLGFFVDSYHDNNYTGYRLSKKYKNINDISKKNAQKSNLANILKGDLDEKSLFKVKKGFFKNTYTANYVYDFSQIYDYKMKLYLFKSNNQETIEAKEYLSNLLKNYSKFEIVEYDLMESQENFSFLNNILNENSLSYEKTPIIIIGNNIFQGYDEQIKNNIIKVIDGIIDNPNDYIDLVSKDFNNNFDLSYNVKLPNKALSSNATSVSNDSKNLSWGLNYFSPVVINYSFSLFNKSSIILIIIILILLLISTITGIYAYNLYKRKKDFDVKNNTNIENIIPTFENDENTIVSIENLMKK